MEKLKAKISFVGRCFIAGCCAIIFVPLYAYVVGLAMIADKLAGRD